MNEYCVLKALTSLCTALSPRKLEKQLFGKYYRACVQNGPHSIAKSRDTNSGI